MSSACKKGDRFMAKRARDWGIPFDGTTGTFNAITDVQGVRVGHSNIIDQQNLLINTGVTAILPLGNNGKKGIGNGIDTFVLAAWHTLNGCGEMTGTSWIEESGLLGGPIMLANTASVGSVRDAVIKYSIGQQGQTNDLIIDPDEFGLFLPVVAETYDGWLNDILGFHIDEAMVYAAIDVATKNPPSLVEEGNVGGGTGMTCYDWKGGIGTSSRMAKLYNADSPHKLWPAMENYPKDGYTVGVLVQANQGTYWDLVIRGVPVGTHMTPKQSPDQPPPGYLRTSSKGIQRRTRGKSSIIVVIATDAPLLPHQLKRLARRAALGIARTGTITNDDSGEIFIAFSTASVNQDAWYADQIVPVSMVPNDNMDPLFEASVAATEEAIINAMIAARSLTGRGGKNTAYAIIPDPSVPIPELVQVMKDYNRWEQPTRKS
jgi:L-aminopeptidase/D-esterase-like protein